MTSNFEIFPALRCTELPSGRVHLDLWWKDKPTSWYRQKYLTKSPNKNRNSTQTNAKCTIKNFMRRNQVDTLVQINNWNGTIQPPDGDEGHVFWLKAIYPFPQNPFLNVNAMFSCKIRPRHWIFCLWWFYAIKLNFEDQNNKRKTHFWL